MAHPQQASTRSAKTVVCSLEALENNTMPHNARSFGEVKLKSCSAWSFFAKVDPLQHRLSGTGGQHTLEN